MLMAPISWGWRLIKIKRKPFDLRLRLYTAQNGRCHWCDVECVLMSPLPFQTPPPDMATTDHLFPRGDYRRHERSFYPKHVMACYECNHRRGSVPVMEWAKKIETPNRRGAGE